MRTLRASSESGTLDLGTTEDRLRQILAADPAICRPCVCCGVCFSALGEVARPWRSLNGRSGISPLAAGSTLSARPTIMDNRANGGGGSGHCKGDAILARRTASCDLPGSLIFAFTGRPRAAMAMIEKRETAPQNYTPESLALWRVSLPALDQRTSEKHIARCKKSKLERSEEPKKGSTSQAAMVMSALWRTRRRVRNHEHIFRCREAGTGNPEIANVREKHRLALRSLAIHSTDRRHARRPPIPDACRRDRIDRLLDARKIRPDYPIEWTRNALPVRCPTHADQPPLRSSCCCKRRSAAICPGHFARSRTGSSGPPYSWPEHR